MNGIFLFAEGHGHLVSFPRRYTLFVEEDSSEDITASPGRNQKDDYFGDGDEKHGVKQEEEPVNDVQDEMSLFLIRS